MINTFNIPPSLNRQKVQARNGWIGWVWFEQVCIGLPEHIDFCAFPVARLFLFAVDVNAFGYVGHGSYLFGNSMS